MDEGWHRVQKSQRLQLAGHERGAGRTGPASAAICDRGMSWAGLLGGAADTAERYAPLLQLPAEAKGAHWAGRLIAARGLRSGAEDTAGSSTRGAESSGACYGGALPKAL